MESDNLNGDVIERFYMQTQEATAFHENLQIYPTREESHAAGLKLIDIAVLDRIARDAATPPSSLTDHGLAWDELWL
ncbi:hypothetical protein FPOA_13489 [Fusarium poae]|uniref:Uncharacterized protein n=1 Tax=Fusarium poae TaxID=36050 RepID=A0A1B8A5E9_FUSPO|nr:hypothetical protein FPOA_13489 [Fusarium poae]